MLDCDWSSDVCSSDLLLHGGPSLDAYHTLPAYAVGQATTEAARKSGFENVITAGPDAQATAQMIANAGHRHIFHPGGRTVRDFDVTELSVTHVPVYHMVPSGDKDGVNHALAQAEMALVHSPRAGERLAELARAEQKAKTAIIAISSAAAAACGAGWRSVYAANAPSDSAMLAMARQICNNPDDRVFTAAPGPT
jgi:uroporphyrinogen-III synthase